MWKDTAWRLTLTSSHSILSLLLTPVSSIFHRQWWTELLSLFFFLFLPAYTTHTQRVKSCLHLNSPFLTWFFHELSMSMSLRTMYVGSIQRRCYADPWGSGSNRNDVDDDDDEEKMNPHVSWVGFSLKSRYLSSSFLTTRCLFTHNFDWSLIRGKGSSIGIYIYDFSFLQLILLPVIR